MIRLIWALLVLLSDVLTGVVGIPLVWIIGLVLWPEISAREAWRLSWQAWFREALRRANRIASTK